MSNTYVYKTTQDCELKGNLFPANEKTAPLIVFIHGGGLIFGTRDDMNKEQIKRYNDAGFHVFSIDYRLAPETKLPEIKKDIEDALQWLQDPNHLALDYDPQKIAVIGSSAGGYLALLSGTLQVKPKAIVSFYGYGNILADWYKRPSAHFNTMTTVPEALAKQLIQSKEIAEGPIASRFAIYLYCRQQGKWLDYVTGTPSPYSASEWEAYCPALQADHSFPTTLLFHGDADDDVPYEESVAMQQALEKAGVQSKLITVPKAKHSYDENMDDPQARESIEQTIAFLKETL
ncbi:MULTISPECIES: alpha/beta hydrolase [unclassified Virgibacillus]|uniref:alpha/beta hydrolase n=1 Tax=unclassified Virgibacillus TaxID=2620237 RepID=UPI0024DE5328|nr:alpha/beta hydrolase [Virgibacillus sp. LDC-1]